MKKITLFAFLIICSVFIKAQPGIIDTTFKIGTGPNKPVYVTTIQPDGKIWVGGAFDSINGVKRSHIALLNADGTIDNSFDPQGGPNGNVYAIALVGNGQIMIGGSFTDYDGVHTHNLVRLNNDGSRDATFNTGVYGFDGKIKAIAIQSDGKINVGGSYSLFEGNFRNGINRLNPNGSEDPSFHHASTGSVEGIGLINDSIVLIGGIFYDYDGIPVNFFARLNNGNLDTTFKTQPGYEIYSIEKTNSGGFFIGGTFEGVSFFTTNVVAKLKPDGTLDSTFAPIVFDPNVKQPNTTYAITERPDGKIIAGGEFNNTSASSPQQYIAMFNSKGAFNSHFMPNKGTNGIVRTLKAQADGKVIVGGEFTSFANSASTRYLTRMIYCNADNSKTVDTTVCSSYNFSGTQYNQSGSYTLNDMSVLGCDSTITLNLTVDGNAYMDTLVIDTTTCGVYRQNEFLCYKTGQYVFETTNQYGCKLYNIVNLTIDSTVSPIITSQPQGGVDCNDDHVSFVVKSNPSYTYDWYYIFGGGPGNSLAVEELVGSYNDINYNTDSLTILQPASSGWLGYSVFALVTGSNGCITKSNDAYISDKFEINATITSCDPYLFGGTYLWGTGNYDHTFTSVMGCDSTVHLDFQRLANSSNLTTTICSGDSIVVADSTLKITGLYNIISTNVNGCDSFIHVDLTVMNPVPVVFNNLPSIVCTASGVVNLDAIPVGGTFTINGSPVTSFDPSNITPPTYVVISYAATDSNGCTTIGSDSVLVDVCTSIQGSIASSVQLQPNPAKGVFSISGITGVAREVRMLNILGELVMQWNHVSSGQQLSTSTLPRGVYFIQINSGTRVCISKIILE